MLPGLLDAIFREFEKIEAISPEKEKAGGQSSAKLACHAYAITALIGAARKGAAADTGLIPRLLTALDDTSRRFRQYVDDTGKRFQQIRAKVDAMAKQMSASIGSQSMPTGTGDDERRRVWRAEQALMRKTERLLDRMNAELDD